jgi:hypothetical protein
MRILNKGKICLAEKCTSPAIKKEMCNIHYKRMTRWGTFEKKRKRNICEIGECERIVSSFGMCASHSARRRRGKIVDGPIKNQSLPIRGLLPDSVTEKAIYFLRSKLGSPFYVGSTSHPGERLSQHRKNFNDKTLEMVIVRCCPLGNEVYWESKLLVDLIEAGVPLRNTVAPIMRSPNS